ncbi:MAG: hypothetical protein KAW16_05925 [candidate division Zixibacteria bacterium]|nr:hypothetical protein [candidate division Zixibacteria bacterium]
MRHKNLLRSILRIVCRGMNHAVHTRGFAFTMILPAMLMFSCFASAPPKDRPIKPNTCRIVTFQDEKENQVMASVSISNNEELAAITLPFSYGNGDTPIRCDSIKFDKTRVEYFELKFPRIDTVKQTILLGLLPDLSGRKPPLKKGDGEVARIYFTLKKGAKFQDFFLDTTLIRPFNRLKFVTPEVKGIYPAFDNKKAMIRGGIPKKPKVEEEAKTEEKKEENSSKKEN